MPNSTDQTTKELEAVKNLLILLLIKLDTPQKEIAKALKIDQGNLSRAFPKKDFEKFKFIEKE